MTAVVFATDLTDAERGGAVLYKATAISIQVCEHGTMYVNFHDGKEAIFATAILPARDAANVLLTATEDLEDVVGALEQAAAERAN